MYIVGKCNARHGAFFGDVGTLRGTGDEVGKAEL